MLVADSKGNIVYSKNADQKMTPASTIKIFTTLAAFHFLGKDFHFKTEFYVDTYRNLIIKGYGDPYLVSEVVEEITEKLAPLLEPMINNIIVDDSHFAQPLTIPGLSLTLRPYNAPNGALCVNFNTVNFKPGLIPGTFSSAEPQTPLLPFALKRIEKSYQKENRIVFSHNENDIVMYSGMLFEYFLNKNGVHIHGQVQTGQVNQACGHLIYTHECPFSLEEIARKLLEHSNNFIANQLLITMGIKKYGPPGTLKKGIDAARSYAKTELDIDQITIAEGSGISRENQISGKTMLKILEEFKPFYRLLKNEKQAFYKTGTLQGISNLAGYIESEQGLYTFVLFISTSGKQAFPVMEMLMQKVK